MAARKRLGERLLERGVIAEAELADALRAQQGTGEELGSALMRLGYVDEDDLMRLLCEDADIPFLDLSGVQPEEGAVQAIPEALARAHGVLPLSQENGRIRVALGNPFDIGAVTALERVTGRPLTVVAAPRDDISRLLTEAYERDAGSPEAPGVERDSSRQAPASDAGPSSRPRDRQRTRSRPQRGEAEEGEDEGGGGAAKLAEELIRRGIAMGATDIHVEPEEEDVAIRYRVDGVLQSGGTYPKATQSSLVTRLKIMAGLNIAESRLPQDGRFRVPAEGRQVDLRISTYPTLHGEDVVLRVLDRGRVRLDLEGLGLAPGDVKLLRSVLKRPHGLILVTGPTGSGKTTTLYSALRELETDRKSVLTLEDPIEYELAGVRQSQINVKAGLTFASGLRSLLRHDPDVILVGEMRDEETVQISLSAALTGHLVLTTVHTNSAAGAIPRLLDMGAEPYVLASSLELVVAQRLVRVLCQQCKAPVDVPEEVRERYDLDDADIYRAQGCSACRQTGYRGRIGVFELLPVGATIEEAVSQARSADEIRRMSDRPTLLQDGLRKVIAGVTSLEEVLKVAGE
ncbi:MAG: GspE/PulE family protein [Longimicrobiales bacterium]